MDKTVANSVKFRQGRTELGQERTKNGKNGKNGLGDPP